ncbi:VanW family protein [bacterium]|nr:VanW family protein [bacterium]NCQ54818.1 VanW family protein [Candidatus Parcubacteria bacterium]NCS66862.1 VanW family protein [Candidatus Peregrinibacteria bacterium]NCS95808.1 VanW family protein [bacterium]
MILGLTALVFGTAAVTPSDVVASTPRNPGFDVSTHIRAQLQERNRMSEAQPANTPEIKSEPFSSYPGFTVSAALINRALNSEFWVKEGAHFDPQFNNQLEQAVQEPFLRERGIKEVLSVGVSDYAGSDARRMQNINATIAKFDGVIIKRGETFSFNEQLGDVTEEEGFTYARVLRNSANAWGLGGGVCQISTNVFRAALNAGLTIEQRRAHSVRFEKYEPAGLDATIYLGVIDLQFTNNTPGDILMKFAMRDEKMITVFYGTKDTRQVSIEKTKHWEGYDGRLSAIWKRNVNFAESAEEESFASTYRPLVTEEVVSE